MSKAVQVPDGWVKGSLSSFTECFSGGTPSRSKSEFYEGSIPWVKSGEVNNRFIYDTEEKISESAIRESSAKLVNPNSILVAMYGATAGKVAVLKVLATTNQAVLAMNPVDSNLCSDFLFWVMEHEAARLMKKVQGAAQPNLSKNLIGNHKVALPPLPEQKAIAALLSTWDEAIEKTEWLIQAKEMRFKRLLNDLIYLPTKEGKWKQIRTKSLFKERKEAKRGDLPLLSITNGEGVIPREDTNRKDTSNEDKSKYLRICPGDIGYNTMRMWQGVSALSSLEGIVSPAYTICIPGEKLYPLFVAYLFKMPFMIHRFYRYSQGLTSDTWNLKFHHFSEVKMPLPSIDEQEQIAETLSAARREIDLLKQLADKYKTQKRGLMQKMLTGEWRVKPEIVNQYMEV
jgi:type I restriction enzyme S subunit